METIKKYKILVIFSLLAIVVGLFSFFYRMYSSDMMHLTAFTASYEKFDKAVSELSVNKTDDSENKANAALIELNANATFRISSLTRNDSLIPAAARRIAVLADKELKGLKAYEMATQSNSSNMEELAKRYNDLLNERKTAYANFQELGQR